MSSTLASRFQIETPSLPNISTDQISPFQVARGLGWFSIGLGLAELLMPHTMANLTGVRSRRVLQAYGLREIATGVGILSSEKPSGWMWARVAGDGLDIATLMAAMSRSGDRGKAMVATAAVIGVTALDALCAAELCEQEG